MSRSFLSSSDRNLQDVFEDAGKCASLFALHWHIVPRYWNHPRWRAPIRLAALSEMADKRLPEQDQQALISELQSVLAVGQTTGIEHETASTLKPPDA